MNQKSIVQSVSAQPSELEGRQLNIRQSVDACFDFPLLSVAVALNTHKQSIDGGRGVRGVHQGPQVYQSSVYCYDLLHILLICFDFVKGGCYDMSHFLLIC